MMENKYQLGEGCVVKKSVIGHGTVIQKDCGY